MVTMPLTRCSLSERADAPSGASEWDSAMGGGAAFPPVGGDKPGERMCATRRRGSMFTCDFSVEEFRARRERVCREIGPEALALIQGSARQSGHSTFRQSNDFYYLCGVEVPHAYLLLDGGRQTSTLFLAHQSEEQREHEGEILSAENAALGRELTGVEGVQGIEFLARYLEGARTIYTPLR